MCVHAWGVEDQHLVNAVRFEMQRVRLWRRRMNPDTGVLFSWLAAMHIVADNPPTFDRMAAQMYWPSTVRRSFLASQAAHAAQQTARENTNHFPDDSASLPRQHAHRES